MSSPRSTAPVDGTGTGTERPPTASTSGGRRTVPPQQPDAWPVGRAGVVAGAALLLLAALSAAGVLLAVEGLVTPDDAAKTAGDVTASEGTFRLAVAGLYVVVVLDIVAAWALFQFFAPVDVWLSRLTAWLRVAYSVVFLVAISQLAAVPGMLGDSGYQDAFGQQQLQAEVMLRLEAFDHTWMAALLLFGAHLAMLGYLAYRSRYVPRLVGLVLVIAGAGYAVDTFSSVLFTDPVVISTVTSLGELVLAIWLLVRGGRVQLRAGHEA